MFSAVIILSVCRPLSFNEFFLLTIANSLYVFHLFFFSPVFKRIKFDKLNCQMLSPNNTIVYYNASKFLTALRRFMYRVSFFNLKETFRLIAVVSLCDSCKTVKGYSDNVANVFSAHWHRENLSTNSEQQLNNWTNSSFIWFRFSGDVHSCLTSSREKDWVMELSSFDEFARVDQRLQNDLITLVTFANGSTPLLLIANYSERQWIRSLTKTCYENELRWRTKTAAMFSL